MLLPDVLGPGLRVVFCGTAASAVSAQVGAPYAGPGNYFWPTLHEVGLTPRRLEPPEFQEVLQWGIGLTDLCKTRSGSDQEIGSGGFDIPGLIAKLEGAPPGLDRLHQQARGERGPRPQGRLRRAARSVRRLPGLRPAFTVGKGPWLLGHLALAAPGRGPDLAALQGAIESGATAVAETPFFKPTWTSSR